MNKVIVACAGSGKTTYIVKKSKELANEHKILITTFTDSNTDEIKKKFFKIYGYMPQNITVLPWFTFLLTHLIKPYQLPFIDEKINSIIMVQGKSKTNVGQNKKQHYLLNGDIYSDKIALLSYKTLNETKHTFSRLKRVFDYIFIDEFQDFEGYDLEIVKFLAISSLDIEIVCDPRQHTFSTHYDSKNHKYTCEPLKYIQDTCKDYFFIDSNLLNGSFRCPQNTIRYASTIFPELPQSDSLKKYEDGDGIVFVKESLINDFLFNNKSVIQLRDSKRTKANDLYEISTFGKSKGLTRENALIYPTKTMLKYILLNDFTEYKSKSDLYVALTRAKHKTGIVIPDSQFRFFDSVKEYIDSFL